MLTSSSNVPLDKSGRFFRIRDFFFTGNSYFFFVFAAFACLIWMFHLNLEFNDSDLYRVLLGLLRGQGTGLWLDDPAQYGIKFGYGYVAMIYWLGEAHAFGLANRDSLLQAINTIGFAASVATVLLMMSSLRIMYGARVALLASIVFMFSPVFLDMATSGHQLLMALAFFFATNLVLVLDVRGPWKIAAYATASVLLFVGLTMRAELPLAFSWLALAQRSGTTSTLRTYILGVVLRSSVCVVAFAAFLIAFHFGVHTRLTAGDSMSSLSGFLASFYDSGNVVRGFVILAVGCGLATLVVLGILIAVEAFDLRSHAFLPDRTLLGPLSLMLIGAVFWIPNPSPARHFTFIIFGISIILGICIVKRVRVGNLGATAAGIAIVFANQALAEVVRPIVLRHLHSVYIHVPEHNPTTGTVPLGSFFRHRDSLVERNAVLTKLARMVVGSCEPKILILSSNGPLMAGLMFAPAGPPSTDFVAIGPYSGLRVVRNNQTFLFVDPYLIWPQDPVTVIMNHPELDGYRIFRDPYSLSSYDKMPIPAGRTANYPASDAETRCDGESARSD